MRLFLKIFIHISNFLSILDEDFQKSDLKNFYTSNFITGLSIIIILASYNIYLQIFNKYKIEINNQIVIIIILYVLCIESLILLLIRFNRSKLKKLMENYSDEKSLRYSKIKGFTLTLIAMLYFLISLFLIMTK